MKTPTARKLAALACATAGLALIAAGCGSDDSSDGEAAGPPLTKEEFIAQADAICAEGDAAITAEVTAQFPDGEEPPVEEQAEFISTVVADGFEDQLNQIRELTPPEEDAEQVNEILDELERLVATTRDNPDALISGDAEGNNADELAQAYGLTDCGS